MTFHLLTPHSASPSSANGKAFTEKVEKCPSDAAMKLQKVYRGYRTRRMCADDAVSGMLWGQALDFTRLNHSTISIFQFLKPESAASRWNRVSLNAFKAILMRKFLYE
ncbi:hypothetical protein ACH5RR_004598 [Cinchona calisaya]|uniref:Uncharacterized protein n=1 Tax=Cinchona calisaya TaxID=153742 RepID=A0ABD3AY04_9GENT